MAVDTSDFKNGMAFYLDGEVYTIIEFQHVKPGKGGAFVRTRLKKLKSGTVLEKTFRSGEKVEPAYLDKEKFQFLYRQSDEIVLMNMDSYEQTHVPVATFGNASKYLKEEMEITALTVDGTPVAYELPNTLELTVVETDPSYKGDTVSGSSTKSAKLETGAVVSVPFHIKEGELIKVDTRTDEYLERVSRK